MSLKDIPLKVLVTGGSGFVGRHLVAALDEALASGSEILIGSSGGPGGGDRGHDFARVGQARVVSRPIIMDVADQDQVDAVIRDEQPTHVVHLAGIAAVTAATRDPRLAWRINLNGTLNVALTVAEHCPGCRIVFSSSAEVYGTSFKAGGPVDESGALGPANPYASSKAAADLMLGQMSLQGLKVTRLRPFNHIGPGQNEQFAVPAFAAQIARIERGLQEPVMRVGSLDSMRDFLDVRDVVDAYLKTIWLTDDLPAGCVMNVASGVPRRIGGMLGGLLGLSKVKIDVVSDPSRFRPSDMPIIVGDSSRARELLGWQPRHDLSSTLSSVLDYWRARVAAECSWRGAGTAV